MHQAYTQAFNKLHGGIQGHNMEVIVTPAISALSVLQIETSGRGGCCGGFRVRCCRGFRVSGL